MIADAVTAELDQLQVTALAPGLAATAIRLAKALDAIAPGDAPTSQAVVADKLHALMVRLRAMAPTVEEGDALDDLAARRAKRLGA